MEERVLKMTNDGSYINNNCKVSYQQTNLPIDSFAFIKEVFWKVAIKTTEYHGKTALQVEVIDYNAKNPSALGKQTLKGEVPFMIFTPFEYERFSYQVACQTSGVMRSLCKDHPLGSKRPIDLDIRPPGSASSYSKDKQLERHQKQMEWANKADETLKPIELPLQTNEITIKQRFNESIIKNGFIEFKRRLPQPTEEITISINNDFLKQEYDLLKEYICKKIGKKTFTIKLVVQSRGNQVISYEASSEDIEKINETFIEEIRIPQIRLLKQVVDSTNEKKLYTVDEVFEKIQKIPGNIFNANINDIIKTLTDGYKHRNSQQIIFLAKNHNANVSKVYLTLKPLFGFLFYIDSGKNHNYIWELLDSHATYIWSFDKAIFSQSVSFTNTDLFIKEVHAKGRNKYKQDLHSKQVNNQSHFYCLEHEMQLNSSVVNFEKWREKLMEVI